MRVLTSIALAAIVGVAAGACAKKEGDACTRGELRCVDGARALVCDDASGAAHMVGVACGGPAGCRSGAGGAACDRSIVAAGDGCIAGERDLRACSADHRALVACDGVRFATIAACRGPSACAPHGGEDGAAVSCDATRAAADDPCTDDGATACGDDGASALRCTRGRFTLVSTCRGDAGCAPMDGRARVRCDDSRAVTGDRCDTPGQPACSNDGTAELYCRDGAFVKTRACRHPCELVAGGVRCD